ncbi:hypothetical protein MASR1M29_20860 [Cloacibacterium normanense]
MEKEFHIYLGKFKIDENEFPLMLYILAEKDSEYNIDYAVSIMEDEGFEDGNFNKVGKKNFEEMYEDEKFKEYFESALEFGYCIVKYT